jgi:1-acyl-sn-glycerol-3-phosphate acyltransferase
MTELPDLPEPDEPSSDEPRIVESGYLYWVTKVVLTPPMALAFRPRIEGLHHVPHDGPALLACNHTSYLDWLLLPLVVRFRRISFLAKMEYFTRPGLRGRSQAYFFSATGQVPVDRAGAHASQGALVTATRLLREGRLVGVFPEGTRTRDGRLNRGRTGVARMAAETGAPVIPCATVGTFAVAPPGARLPRPHKISVRFGAPMPPVCAAGAVPTAERLREWTDELMARIGELSEQDYSGVDAVGLP